MKNSAVIWWQENLILSNMRSHQNFCRKIADDHSIINFDKKSSLLRLLWDKWFDTRDTVFCHPAAQSSSRAPWHASLCGVFFFGWSVMPFGPPLAPPCFPLLVARKVSYCPSMYDDGLVAVNACEHSVISSNMASSVQNTKSLEYVILYGEHRIFYDLKKTFPMSLSKYSYLSL